jgi:hypothetical protein
MKLNTQRVLEMCIDDGIKDALNTCKDRCTTDDQLIEQISNFIWLQLDYYFTFEDND